MKLKSEFITYNVGEKHVAVAAENVGKALNGMIRSNDTAYFIFKSLMSDTTEEEIVNAILDEYDVSRDVATQDVHLIINQLREEGFLDE